FRLSRGLRRPTFAGRLENLLHTRTFCHRFGPSLRLLARTVMPSFHDMESKPRSIFKAKAMPVPCWLERAL
ncbi:MAG: hypothetical protein WBQ29_20090, partial [Isosphaeraceae bacterium]